MEGVNTNSRSVSTILPLEGGGFEGAYKRLITTFRAKTRDEENDLYNQWVDLYDQFLVGRMDIRISASLHDVYHIFWKFILLLLITRSSFINAQCLDGDTTGPTLTCVNSFTLPATVPNLFFGFSRNVDYTAIDPSDIGPSSAVYNLAIGLPSLGGFIFPPGATPVEFTVSDTCGNPSTCTVNVINELTEIPVNNCPDFTRTVDTDDGAATYQFSPGDTYGPSDVTTNGVYFYHGPATDGSQVSTVEYEISPGTIAGPPFMLPVGTHTVTTTISDAELSFTCSSTITVQGTAASTTTTITTTAATTTTTESGNNGNVGGGSSSSSGSSSSASSGSSSNES